MAEIIASTSLKISVYDGKMRNRTTARRVVCHAQR